MNKAQSEKLSVILAKLEALQREMLSSNKHKHDTAIERIEAAKTELLRIQYQ